MNYAESEIQTTNKKRKPFFTLTRKNQKGQVAIFVALIFQIVFIFFALLINVGLLVHHKINLQQSTDLAAYYGAMKQAEMLNVIAHVNFQIRQAWKLLTWRYRILGTFGYQSDDLNLKLPIKIGPGQPPQLEYQDGSAKCPPGATSPDRVNLNDLPIFCVGHDGFSDWLGSAGTSSEACKIKCSNLDGAARPITTLTPIGTASVPGANVAAAVAAAMSAAVSITGKICRDTTARGAGQIANMLAAYFNDVDMKKKSIKLLTKNLLASSDNFTDLDQKLVKTGALNTLKNNLTEANLSSLSTNYKFINGISSDNPNVDSCNTDAVFLNEIKFQFVQFFMDVCTAPATGTPVPASGNMRNDDYESIFDLATGKVSAKVRGVVGAGIADAIDAVSQQFSIGFEKNPWCQVYYGVQSKAEPKIPFLPISKIQLNAIAFAKPFGGSIGPWSYKEWPSGAAASDKNKTPVDKLLPKREFISGGSSAMKQNIELLLNYSNYVGDDAGLSDSKIVGIYHDFLFSRSISANSPLASNARFSGSPEASSRFIKPAADSWPAFRDWSNTSLDLADPEYDPIVMSNPTSSKQNSGIRDLEISIVAPNQFDTTYYSIDSDFYNNYFKGRLDNSTGLVSALISKFSTGPVIFKPDYGYSAKINTSQVPEATSYSVRHQLAVVSQVFKGGAGINQLLINLTSSQVSDKYFTFIPKSPASLLTGWTFRNLTDATGYTTFPSAGSGTSMPFGNCNDASPHDANSRYESITKDPTKPPTPGNCVTGGRTGYSVKIVSQEAINGLQGDIGGQGTGGQTIRNPIPPQFLNFQ